MATIADMTKTALRPLSLKGRASRREFLFVLVLAILAAFTITFIGTGVLSLSDDAMLVVWPVATMPVIATAWRRLHDTGLPGWPALLPVGLLLLTPLWVWIDQTWFAGGGQLAGIVGGLLGLSSACLAAAILLLFLLRRGPPAPTPMAPPHPVPPHSSPSR